MNLNVSVPLALRDFVCDSYETFSNSSERNCIGWNFANANADGKFVVFPCEGTRNACMRKVPEQIRCTCP